jgi:adenylate cyclase
VRVERSFAFLDLSDFTALTDAQGDEHAVAVLHRFRALVREVCSRRAVRIAKWLGDGAMLVGVGNLSTLETVLEVQFASSRLPGVAIRTGVTAGPVILCEGDDYIGNAVNMAARLCELAPAGAILADPPLAADLPKWGVASNPEEFAVRGLGRTTDAVRLDLRPLGAPTSDDPICGIPLTRDVAAAVGTSDFGPVLLFCSASCHDTWMHRPPPPPEEHGAVRKPLIGS